VTRVAREPADPASRHWRFRPNSMGPAALLGEVGSHAFNLATYITGRRAIAVSTDMSTIVERREVYNNAYLTLRYTDGAQGRIWASYVAAGTDQELWFRIFGDKGSLTWHQEKPSELWHKPLGGPAICIAPSYDGLSAQSLMASRLRPGHPEGYVLVFANLYTEFARAVIAQQMGQDHRSYLRDLPGISDDVAGMALIAAAKESQEAAEALLRLGAEKLYFDSTPAGNIGPVAEAPRELLKVTFVPFAPAFPENGHRVFRGIYLSGMGCCMKVECRITRSIQCEMQIWFECCGRRPKRKSASSRTTSSGAATRPSSKACGHLQPLETTRYRGCNR
jgi:hypothetical protein